MKIKYDLTRMAECQECGFQTNCYFLHFSPKSFPLILCPSHFSQLKVLIQAEIKRCTVCGNQVNKCFLSECKARLEGNFYCWQTRTGNHQGWEYRHFCLWSCWEKYILKIAKKELKPAQFLLGGENEKL